MLALIAALSPTIGGTTGLWPLGVLFAAAGISLMVAPPKRSLGASANMIFVLLIVLSFGAWLPADWWTSRFWRGLVRSQFGITLPPTRSPQPWLTLEATGLLFGNLCWAYWVFSHPWRHGTRRVAVRIFCSGILLITAIALGAFWTGHKIPLWPRVLNSTADFGFFVNRNQTANILALSGILVAAIAYDDLRGGRKRAIFWIAGLVMLGGALVVAYSRAGIALFFAGIAFWALICVRFSKSGRSLAIMVTAVALLLAGFFTFGGETLKRFQSLASGGSRDFRVPIQQDAFQLSLRAPWLGSGMGNFEPMFRLVRDKSRQQDYALHPDSDWLWTAVDLGWIAVSLLLVGLAIWIRRCFPFDSRESTPLRLAALVYGLGFAAVGLVDVSGHRIGTFWPALFAMSLAICSDRRGVEHRWVGSVFRCCGMLLVAIAGCWLAPVIGQNHLPTSDTLTRYQQAAEIDFEGADYDHLVEMTTAALRIAPLDWNSYSQRAVAEANLAETEAAIRDFRIARFLQPHFIDICLYEGSLWLDFEEPAYALEAWSEALRRVPDGGGLQFAGMLAAAASRPEVRAQLYSWAIGDPKLQLAVLAACLPAEFSAELDTFFGYDPELKRISHDERKRFFRLWEQRGDRARLTALLLSHPEWEREEWSILSRQYAIEGDFRRAYETVRRFATKPQLPKLSDRSQGGDAEKKSARDPGDLVAGLRLYGLQMRDGSLDEALATLQQLKRGQPKLRYLSFMEAELLAQTEDWKGAWGAWEEFAAAGE